MATIKDYLKPAILGEYYTTNSVDDEPYLGEMLFPVRKKVGLDLSFIKGANNSNVLLKTSTFDTIAEVRNRLGFETLESEMGLFRESMRIGEKEYQELLRLLNAPNSDEYVKATLIKIYDDFTNLVRSARRVPERMRMELLSTGKIEIGKVNSDNTGVAYKYDYKDNDFDAKNTVTLTTAAKWDAFATADPYQDIFDMQEKIESQTGVRPTNAIMTQKTLNYIIKNEKIKSHFTSMNGGGLIINKARILQFLQEELGLTIYVYNKKYTDYDGKSKNYYPDNKVTLFPDGNLGNTWYGTTNEEAQLMSGVNQEVAVVDTGVAVLTVVNPHPVNETVYVAEIVLPSFEEMNKIAILTVA